MFVEVPRLRSCLLKLIDVDCYLGWIEITIKLNDKKKNKDYTKIQHTGDNKSLDQCGMEGTITL